MSGVQRRVYCPSCAGTLQIDPEATSVACPYCGAMIKMGTAEVRVEGHSAEEVEKVTLAALAAVHNNERANAQLRSPWVSGSFYLVVLLSVLSLLLVAGAVLPIWVVPVVIIGGILGVLVVGALQLRQDARLNEKSFVELMRLTLARLPLLTRTKPPE